MKQSEGFTLLEVLIAVSILTLTLFIAFTVNSRSVEMESRARNRLKAILAAEALMNEKIDTFPDLGKTSGKFEFAESEYNYVLSVSEVPHPDAREVVLEVTFLEDSEPLKITLHGVSRK